MGSWILSASGSRRLRLWCDKAVETQLSPNILATWDNYFWPTLHNWAKIIIIQGLASDRVHSTAWKKVVFPDLAISEEAAVLCWEASRLGVTWTVASSFGSISPVSVTARKKDGMLLLLLLPITNVQVRVTSHCSRRLSFRGFSLSLSLSLSHLTPLAVAACDEEYGSEQSWDLAINLKGESSQFFPVH